MMEDSSWRPTSPLISTFTLHLFFVWDTIRFDTFYRPQLPYQLVWAVLIVLLFVFSTVWVNKKWERTLYTYFNKYIPCDLLITCVLYFWSWYWIFHCEFLLSILYILVFPHLRTCILVGNCCAVIGELCSPGGYGLRWFSSALIVRAYQWWG